MSRKTKDVLIGGATRDTGKLFVVTEMSARDAHKWATRAMFAMLSSGVEMPDDLAETGFAGIATLGVRMLSGASHALMEPLLDELLTCVQVVPDPANRNVKRNDFERDIEEAQTFFVLQKEVLMLHVEPFMSAVKSSGALTATPPLA